MKHRSIALYPKDKILLYFSNMMGFSFGNCWSKRKKLQNLFDEASERIEKQFDVVKIVKGLREVKILMENSFMTDDIKKQLKHDKKIIIDLSSNEETDSNNEAHPEI